MVNFEVASFSSFQDFTKRLFCDGEVGDGSSGVNAIWNQPEDLITTFPVRMQRPSRNMSTGINLWIASFSSFRENPNQPFM